MTWQPIQTAPTEETVLLANPKGLTPLKPVKTGWYDKCLGGWRCDITDRVITPTHWMSLPEPPIN